MLKKRIVATLVVREGIVVQSIGFKKYLPVGKPHIAFEFLNRWGIDEIILLDITAGYQRSNPDYEMIKKATQKCLVPLTVGGGITEIDQVKDLMHCGADKISVNQAALHTPDLVRQTANIFGNQCVVVSVDVVLDQKGHYWVYDYLRKSRTDFLVSDFVKQMESTGAGEILINAVDRDGSYLGYDVNLIRMVCEQVKIPVICVGGARNALDFIEIFSNTTVSAAAAGNFFHFTEHSVNTTKANVKRKFDVRLDTHADYSENEFDENLRLLKKRDSILEDMLFVRIEKEVI